MHETKVCTQCKQEKMLSEFYIERRALDKRTSACKVCARQKGIKWLEENKSKRNEYLRRYRKLRPDLEKNRQLKHRFGITLEDYHELKKQQSNNCAICKISFDDVVANVDHCHTTGKVRGLLCSKCNHGLGLFKDSVDNLNEAINFLLTSRKKYDTSTDNVPNKELYNI